MNRNYREEFPSPPSSPSKSAKISPNGSPSGRWNQKSVPDVHAVDFLAEYFQNLDTKKKQSDNEPEELVNADDESVALFLSQLEEYELLGGTKKIDNFINSELLAVLKCFEMNNESASADEIKSYLKGLVKTRTWIDIHEALTDQVKIDLSAKFSGKEKIQSLFKSFYGVCKRLGIQHDGTHPEIPGFQYHTQAQIDCLLLKLPEALQKRYRLWTIYHPKFPDMKSFYQDIIELEKECPDAWGGGSTLYEKEVAALARDKRMLRSSKK